MSEWPVWFPGLELRASHLLGLEDYVLSRASLDRHSHGVDEFDPRQALEIGRDPNGLTLRLTGGKGLTPSGHPVVVASALETTVAAAPSATYVLDIWVEVNAADARTSKLALRASAIHALAPAFDVYASPSSLYFGRYRIQQLDPPALVSRPRVRTLAACRPHDAAWEQWVRPLADALRALRGYSEKRGRGTAALQVLQQEATRLLYAWPTLPIHGLAEHLRFAYWLKTQSAAPDGLASPPLTIPDFPPPLATGDDLPQLLAAILEPQAGLPVKQVLSAVLDRIYLRVPLAEFRQWRNWIAQPDSVTDVDAIEHAIQERPQQPRFERWTRATGLLTIHAFERADAIAWPKQALVPYLAGTDAVDVPQALANTLDQLIVGEALQWPAGPLGFYEVASAAARSSDIVAASSASVRSYFSQLGRRGSAAASPSAGDRVSTFATQRQQDPGEAASRIAGVVIAGVRSRALAAAELDTEVAILGPRSSCKTSLVRALRRAVSDGSAPALANRIAFKPHPLLDLELDPRPGRVGIERFEARLEHAGGEVGRLTIVDVPADAVVAADGTVASILASARVIVIANDAAALDRSEQPLAWFAQIEKLVGPALHGRPDVQVAIAFTKADEYGTVDPQELRLLSRLEEVLLLERLRDAPPRDVDAAWKQFVDGVSLAARFGEAFGETRRRLLEQTRELWTALVREHQHLAVNGYFIAADPVDRYYAPWGRRGVLQLFADTLAATGLAGERA